MKELVLVGIGGFAGIALRYAVSRAMLPLAASSRFAWHSLLVSAVGSLLVGALLAYLRPAQVYYFQALGFCGGFVALSMFSLEMFRMIRLGQISAAAAYLPVSIVASLLGVAGGFLLISEYNY